MTQIAATKRPLLIEHDITVCTYDIDFAGHVSNIVYLRWLEMMRFQLFEEHFPLRGFMESGFTPIIAATSLEYKRAISLFDKPKGFMWVSEVGRATLEISAEIFVEEQLTTRAKHTGVFINSQTKKPVRVPEIISKMWAAES